MGKHFVVRHSTLNKRKTAAVIAVVSVAALVILFVSGVGQAIAKNILMPVFGSASEGVTPVPDGHISGNITCPRLDLYTLQMAVFDKAEQATAYAKSIAERGGAGYMLSDGGYRVLASGYATQAEAQSVADKQTDKEAAPVVYMLSSGSASFKTVCKEQEYKALSNACEYYPKLIKELVDESLKLDKCEVTASYVRVSYTTRLNAIDEIISQLEALPPSADSELVPRLLTLYRNARLQIGNISIKNSKEGLDFFAEIKYNYIEMTIAYCDMIKNLS